MTLKILDTDLLHGINQDQEVVIKGDINHLFNKQDLLAVWGAYHAGRPLLLRGKPGTGKSQFAKAIAQHLDWAFVSEVMHGGIQLDDLHWHYDAINRLGEAQSLAYTLDLERHNSPQPSQTETTPNSVTEILDHKHFIRPGVFWWAFDWKSAKACFPEVEAGVAMLPQWPEHWDEKKRGVVLLIDEIDKAEPDLPNGLLQTLGDLQFNVPYIHKHIKAGAIKPLIIITTNEERELPTALVRRCYTHTLKMEAGDDKINWLVKRGKLHFGTEISAHSYQEAAIQLWKDRKSEMRYPPGLAEYLDLLRPLCILSKKQQKQQLALISQFVYHKEAEQ